MKSIIHLMLVVFLLSMCMPLTGDNVDVVEEPIEVNPEGPGQFQLDPFLMQTLPGGFFYTAFFEHYAPDTTLLTEESNGFSLLDNPRVYFEGDSFVNFNWTYNGLGINSGLNSGSPGVLLPFSAANRFRLQGRSPAVREPGFDFITTMPQESFSQLTISTVYSDLGGYIGTWTIQPDHPALRADRLYNERRKIDGNYFLDYRLNKRFKHSALMFAANYFDMTRQFNDFNHFDHSFKEDGKLLLLNTRYRRELSDGFLDFFAVFNYKDRSNQLAELGVYPQETSADRRTSLLAGTTYSKRKLTLTLALMMENEEITPFVDNYSKDLMDNDGDLLNPYGQSDSNRLGNFKSTQLNLDVAYSIVSRLFSRPLQIDSYAKIRYNGLSGRETSHQYNAVLFNDSPYQVVKWNAGQDYANTNIYGQAGVNIRVGISDKLALLTHIMVGWNQLRFDYSENNINVITPGFDAGLQMILSRRKRSSILLAYGRMPYRIPENSNFFLEQNRPDGTIYNWNDINEDNRFQSGEEGSVYGYTGGKYHYLDPTFKAPMTEQMVLHFTTKLSENFTLNIKGIYKKIKHNLRIRFDREYGFTETHNGEQLYFFNQPFSDYYLGSGGYEKDPFYAQFHFNIKGRRAQRWFYSFSFMAHMGMGVTAFGNGPASNDIGILDESQANPNSWINGFGRLDGDRGFVAKSYFGWYLGRKLFLSVSIKYRDGNAFAFYNTTTAHDQRIIYYSTIKAENEKGVKGGPREDYVADVSLRLNYSFKLFNREALLSLTFFNLLDFGAELSEYVFSGGTRDAQELQIPRSLRLTLGWRF